MPRQRNLKNYIFRQWLLYRSHWRNCSFFLVWLSIAKLDTREFKFRKIPSSSLQILMKYVILIMYRRLATSLHYWWLLRTRTSIFDYWSVIHTTYFHPHLIATRSTFTPVLLPRADVVPARDRLKCPCALAGRTKGSAPAQTQPPPRRKPTPLLLFQSYNTNLP